MKWGDPMMLEKFKAFGLLKKITLVYIAFIVIPAILVFLIVYYQTYRYTQMEAVDSGKRSLEQMNYYLKNKTDIVESISNNISLNPRLNLFLSSEFEMSADTLEEYRTFISPLLEYAMSFHKVNLRRIAIYMNNNSIPTGFGTFYHDDIIRDKEWFSLFAKSDKTTMWMIPEKNDFSGETGDTLVFTYVQKIFSINGKYLGFVVIDIPLEKWFSFISNIFKGDEKVFILDRNNQFIYPITTSNERTIYDPVLEGLVNSNDYSIQRGEMYIYEKGMVAGITVGMVKTNFNKFGSFRAVSVILMVFILLAVILIVMFYVVLRKFFVKINKSIKIMNKAIESDYGLRIPIDRKDEIGQIAERFNMLIEKIQALIKDSVKRENAHKDAQLRALQMQINPHFIYNTLDIFVMKAELAGNYEVAEAIVHFGKMLRYNMNLKLIYTSLQTAIQYVVSYMSIQKLKYGDKVHLNIDLPEELVHVPVLKFMIQPIVENSIKHGMKGINRMDGTLQIHIGVKRENRRIRIVVSDNGSGIDEESLARLNSRLRHFDYESEQDSGDRGIGLQNINERLKLFFSKEYYIQIESVEGRYTRTIFTIPESDDWK